MMDNLIENVKIDDLGVPQSILDTAGIKHPEILSLSATSWHHFHSGRSKRLRRCLVDWSGGCDC